MLNGVYALLSVYYAGCVLCELKVDMYVAHMWGSSSVLVGIFVVTVLTGGKEEV